ncbi:hypothetical protein EBU60_06465, partial [bacterium]|nr:hypothetical protein [bacterium]
TLQPGAELDLPWRPDFNALVYALSGRGAVGAEFVMNTRDEVVQAFEDYQAGKLGVIPAAHSNPHNTPTSVVESGNE